MILARVISGAAEADLQLAFARMGLPASAREYLLAKIPYAHVLLTGLEREHARFLRGLSEKQDAPGHEEFPAFVSGDQQKQPGAALLSGRRDQFDHLIREAKADAAQGVLAKALEAALNASLPPEPITLGSKKLSFGGRPYLMGIVNVTPDSFSDGGKFIGADAAIAHAEALVKGGADLLDVGGESTRPGSAAVPVEEELRRVVPVIQGIKTLGVPISIDTRKHEVAREALNAGATLVNDVSGLQFDPKLARVTAEANAALCLMHTKGTPETMQQSAHYEDSISEILEFLADAVAKAITAGVARSQILVDPGIGFAKTFAHNHFLLRRLSDFRVLGLPVLLGPSRKAFLGALTGGKPANERVLATAACVAAVNTTGGADIIRVHDVAEVRDALVISEAIRSARDGGTRFSGG